MGRAVTGGAASGSNNCWSPSRSTEKYAGPSALWHWLWRRFGTLGTPGTLGTLVFSVPSIRYGISPWLGAVPVKKRPEFPAFRGVITHPVVIVGGGMSGAMTAYACATAGLKVMLLEADRIGLGGSGRATGLLSGEACDSYRELEARAGRRAARAMFDAMQSAPKELAATVKRIGIQVPASIRPIIFASSCMASPTSCFDASSRRARNPD